MSKKTPAVTAPAEEEMAVIWPIDAESSQVIVKNVYSSMVVVPHGLDKDTRPLVLQPGEERILEDVAAWSKSPHFRRLVEGSDSEPSRLRVYKGSAPRTKPMPPPALTQNLTAAQLHTVDQILALPFERALEIISVEPRGDSDVDAETGISQAGLQWLARTHLRVLRCARWIEEHSDRRQALLAALDRRIKEIHELVAPSR